MFKNCTKNVCPTSSIVNEPNPKKLSVLRHSRSEKSTGNSLSTQGTNRWLRNGGALPLVSVDPTSSGTPSSSKHVKPSVQPVKSSIASKQRAKLQGQRHLYGVTSSTKKDCHTQASLRSKQDKESKRDEPFAIDKENYMNIIVSHFNEQSNAEIYNPDEFTEEKNKASAPSCSNAKRTLQASTPSEQIYYSEKDKAKILLSIREELRSWKCDVALSDRKVLGE